MGSRARRCATTLVLGCSTVASTVSGQVTRVGGEFQVNTHTLQNQDRASVAADGAGGFVAVWASAHGGISADVFAQRFAASGARLGAEFQVNTYTTLVQDFPAVAATGAGDFIVAWQSEQDGSGFGIFARRFSAAGAALATEFQVNSYTQGFQAIPTVGLGAAGDFLIAWQSAGGQDGSQYGVFARRFTSSGSPLAAEFQVNAYINDNQLSPTAAVALEGDFAVAWRSSVQDGSNSGIFARRFDSAGNPLDVEFQVNTYTQGVQGSPSIAIAGNGDFVVVWESFGQDGSGDGVFGRRFDAGGNPLAGEFPVNSYVIGNQYHAEVRADGDGDFVVAWESGHQDDGVTTGVFARRFDSAGNAQATEFRVNNYTPQAQRDPAIGMAPDGDFVIAWSSSLQDGSSYGVFAQRFAVSPKVFDIDGNGAVEALTDGLLFLRYAFGFRDATLVTGAVAPNCSRCTHLPIESYLAGLAAVASAKKSGPEFQVNSYTPGDQLAAAAAADADGSFVVAWQSAQDGSGLGIFARRFHQNGAPLTGELEVNQYATGAQNYPEVAMDAAGDFIVAWQSYGQDGSGLGIFARGFNSAGNPRAAEFQVNVVTTYWQQSPGIAMDAAGDFVVVWASNPEYGLYNVMARRFNAALTPLASEFVVTGVSRYSYPKVAMSPNGQFVVAWWLYGIFGRRFDASGAPVGGEFQASTFVGDLQGKAQSQHRVAVGGDGFVVSWTSQDQDGSGLGVFARRFDSAGAAQGGELQVNSFTSGNQSLAVAKATGSGEFVVSWTSAGQDGSGNGVFARRFNSAGAPQATELQVNKLTAGAQAVSTLAMDASGDFVAAWQSAAQDGSGYGIFAERFKVGRTADIDGDGVVGPLTDGLLFLRYAFGFRDATLITGAVGPNCTRCTAVAIESYIAGEV